MENKKSLRPKVSCIVQMRKLVSLLLDRSGEKKKR
jgi:hypothetical protein